MTRLRFIKDWGPYKAGNIMVTESPTTVMWLVDRYGFAVIEPVEEPRVPEPEIVRSAYAESRFLREPRRDKMQRPPKKSRGFRQ